MGPYTSIRLHRKTGKVTAVCPTCGQKQHGRPRRRPDMIAKSLDRNWALLAYPLRYSIARLSPVAALRTKLVYREVQRIPRTRNTYVDYECDAAVSAMHRRMREHKKEIGAFLDVIETTRVVPHRKHMPKWINAVKGIFK